MIKWETLQPTFRQWDALKDFHAISMHLKSNIAVNGIRESLPMPKISEPGIKLENNSEMFKKTTLKEALNKRRTSWQFKGDLTFGELSEIIRLSFGNTKQVNYQGNDFNLRSYPSAGAMYTVEPYIWIQNMGELFQENVYKWNPDKEELVKVGHLKLEVAQELTSTTKFNVQSFKKANALVFFIADVKHIFDKYGMLAYRLVFLESGHMCQNLQLTTCSLNHSLVPLGGFYDMDVEEVLGLNEKQICTYIAAIG